MKLFVLFGQRKESYSGEYAPEALLCWDEFCVEENPDGFEEACAAAKKEAQKNEIVRTRLIEIKVDGDKIDKLLNGNPSIEGFISEAPKS